MFDRALLWRATDFWREGLTPRMHKVIGLYNTWEDKKRKLGAGWEYESIEQAAADASLPAHFFQDVAKFWWYVKEDGYLVSLDRAGPYGPWSMHTRGGVRLTPPPEFLAGLGRSEGLPNVMLGELVTSFTGCAEGDRADPGRRNVLRNEQFARIHRVIVAGGDAESWEGLRVKVFAFPTSKQSIGEAYELYANVLENTIDLHPHIGLCRAGRVGNAADAIAVFRCVVRLGLEGIVLVNSNATYGETYKEDRHDEKLGTFFKLKQKTVLAGTQFYNWHKPRAVWKDGTRHDEHRFKTTVDGEEVFFTDQQDRPTGVARLKYMEYVPGMDRFPCRNGYRHMHFATHEDMSVTVPAAAADEPAPKFGVLNVLGWDARVRRILNWDIAEDRTKLAGSSARLRMHNPRPFLMREAEAEAAAAEAAEVEAVEAAEAAEDAAAWEAAEAAAAAEAVEDAEEEAVEAARPAKRRMTLQEHGRTSQADRWPMETLLRMQVLLEALPIPN